MTLAEAQQQFDHRGRGVYLDHASMGPLPRPARAAVEDWLRLRSADDPNAFPHVIEQVEALRARFARLVGVEASRVEYAPNTSYALNVLAQGLDWRPGDRVAVPEGEFPANVHPWLGLASRGVVVDRIPCASGTFTVESVERTLRPETRLLAVSWVQFLSGFRCDLDALSTLCRERGVLLAVDAIQGLGALRLDLRRTPVDFLATGSHKWMLGLTGLGFLVVSEALQERLAPVRGWLNGAVDWDDLTGPMPDLHDDARRFRLGTLNLAGLVALDASLGLYEALGPEVAEATVLRHSLRLGAELHGRGFRRFGCEDPVCASGIVTVGHPRAEALYEALTARGVTIAQRNRLLRFSPSWPTTDDELETALDHLDAALADIA